MKFNALPFFRRQNDFICKNMPLDYKEEFQNRNAALAANIISAYAAVGVLATVAKPLIELMPEVWRNIWKSNDILSAVALFPSLSIPTLSIIPAAATAKLVGEVIYHGITKPLARAQVMSDLNDFMHSEHIPAFE